MGYLENNNNTMKIVTKLTSYGKEMLLTNGTDLIKYFRVGDSDANYYVSEALPCGTVPSNGGNNTGVVNNTIITSPLNVKNTSEKYKVLDESSITVVTDKKESELIREDLSGELININSVKGNLFKSFNLPITQAEKALFMTNQQGGGLFRSVIGNFNTDNILIYPIKNEFGNIINGKDIKISLNTNEGGNIDLYSTYSSQIKSNEEKFSDEHPVISKILKNTVLLFSDTIKRPMGDKNLSWSTGHKNFKPFKLGGKKKYNFSIDESVGFISLDLGFLIITNKNLIDKINNKASIEYTSFKEEVYQTINLLMGRNEFYMSNNSTFSLEDDPRITEFELLDVNKKVIAYSKLNTPIIKRKHEQISINVRIMV